MFRSRPRRDPVGPGQESVWDYPRPPAVQACGRRIRVVHRGVVLVDTRTSWRVLETAHAPAYYLPAEDILSGVLRANRHSSVCEFKGLARYADLVLPGEPVVPDACWWYPAPTPGYESIAGAVCFYPQRVDLCEVDGEAVRPLTGSFYGDWPTSDIAGPYKGAPGTEGW